MPPCSSYIGALTDLGQAVLRGVALSLGLDADYFAAGYTASPTVLFRVFRYPAPPPGEEGWGAGEHTDYGLLTLLAQDANGGLQVRTPSGWIDAPPIEGTFVANIGDMLDRLTGGWYRSTPHRVRNVSGRDRFSFPFFFDPGFSAEIPPLPGRAAVRGGAAQGGGRRRRAALGRAEPARVQRHLRRLPAGQGVQGVPAAPAGGANGRSALTRAARPAAA